MNIITDRIKYFIQQFPPFSLLAQEELEKIVENVTVKYVSSENSIFKQGDEQGEFWYVVRQGSVDLYVDNNDGKTFVDKCEEGDVFGIRSLISGRPYRLTAYCNEECILYQIDKEIFHSLFESDIQFSNFFARGYAQGTAVAKPIEAVQGQFHSFNDLSKIDGRKKVLTAHLEDTIFHIANQMKDHNVGSIVLVNDQNHPLGIITDTDLRNKVVAQQLPTNSPGQEIMSGPVQTIPHGLSMGEMVITMIKTGKHHLVITEDGTINSGIIGIISDHDLMISQGNHPAALIKQIRQVKNLDDLPLIRDKAQELVQNYLESEVSVDLVAGFISEINDQIVRKGIHFGLEKVAQTYPGIESIPFAWLALGSEGREEQLLRTDQDNALVYADGHDEFTEGFLELAKMVNDLLERCGFANCPAEIMAKNTRWNQSLSKWQQDFSTWITKPDPKAIMNTTIFFDYRLVYGNDELVDELNQHLTTLFNKHEIFFNFLAQNALQNPPPIGFFRGFIVEKDGQHKDQFDIKGRAMMPIADIARLLVLHKNIPNVKGTIDRLKAIVQQEPNLEQSIHECIDAYKLYMKVRALSGMKHDDSGRYIHPSELNKLQRQLLKKSFEPIKELQEAIHVRFQLSYFN